MKILKEEMSVAIPLKAYQVIEQINDGTINGAELARDMINYFDEYDQESLESFFDDYGLTQSFEIDDDEEDYY